MWPMLIIFPRVDWFAVMDEWYGAMGPPRGERANALSGWPISPDSYMREQWAAYARWVTHKEL